MQYNTKKHNTTNTMFRDTLAKVAKSNKDLINGSHLQIPQTTVHPYNPQSIVQSPINGKTSTYFYRMKTDDCAMHFMDNYGSKNVVVMNFASRHHAGGGYLNGARAQEEDLCRVMPTLYSSISKVKYPYDPDTVLITPNVDIMRENTQYRLLKKPYTVSVVSAAAPNLSHEKFDEDRIRRTLSNLFCSVAQSLPNTDTLILGAWGCGVYGNDPVTMAKIMDDITKNYGGYFKTVVFSVPEGVNTEEFSRNITLIRTGPELELH